MKFSQIHYGLGDLGAQRSRVQSTESTLSQFRHRPSWPIMHRLWPPPGGRKPVMVPPVWLTRVAKRQRRVLPPHLLSLASLCLSLALATPEQNRSAAIVVAKLRRARMPLPPCHYSIPRTHSSAAPCPPSRLTLAVIRAQVRS